MTTQTAAGAAPLRERLRYCGHCGHGTYDHTASRGCWACPADKRCMSDRRECEVSAVVGWAASTMQQPEAIEAVAKTLAGMRHDEVWPSNATLGGGLTGTRDDEYRDEKIQDARDALYTTLGVLMQNVGEA